MLSHSYSEHQSSLSTQGHCRFLSVVPLAKVFELLFFTRPQLAESSAHTVTTPCLWIRVMPALSSVTILLDICSALWRNAYLNLSLNCSSWKFFTHSAGTWGSFPICWKFYRLLKNPLGKKTGCGWRLLLGCISISLKTTLNNMPPTAFISRMQVSLDGNF